MKIRIPQITFPDHDLAYAPRPRSIDGLTIGFLDGWGDGPSKTDATGMYPTMEALKTSLQERFPTINTVWALKPDINNPVPVPVLEDFARRVDLVINGEGL